MPASYTILGGLAKGGMASVYLGRMTASAGFSRLVAIKRLHPELAADKDFIVMLVDEARLAGQIRHPNVIDTLDLFASEGAFSLVLEYVEGESLSALTRHARKRSEPIPQPIAVAIVRSALRGLDAAHEARSEDGTPLKMVHRDVSPQNILVGVDGIPRIIDFGIAKASGRLATTRPGEVRGKFSYMAPEQLLGRPVTRQADVYAVGVILWELLTGQRLFWAEDSRAVCAAVLRGDIALPSMVNSEIPKTLDAIVARATARDVANRYDTAAEMLKELETHSCASDTEIGAWVRSLAAKTLADRQKMLSAVPAPLEPSSLEVMSDLARSLHTPDTPVIVSSEARPPPSAVGPLSASGVAVAASPLHARGVPLRRNPFLLTAIAGVAVLTVIGTFVGAKHVRDTAAGATATATATTTFTPEMATTPIEAPPVDRLPPPEAQDSIPPATPLPAPPPSLQPPAISAATPPTPTRDPPRKKPWRASSPPSPPSPVPTTAATTYDPKSTRN